MKRKCINFIGTICFVCILFFVLKNVSYILSDKRSEIKYYDFFSNKTDFDIIFMGTSHIFNTIYPMELWKEYGISSYNWGYSNCTLAENYWILQDIIKYNKPKLVVIDFYGLVEYDNQGNGKYRNDRILQQHVQFDSIPFSYTKYKGVMDIFDDYDSRADFLFNILIYHERWNKLTKNDFCLCDKSTEKGAEFLSGVGQNVNYLKQEVFEDVNLNSVCSKYIPRVINLCKENDMDLLFVYLPYNADLMSQNLAHTIPMFLNQYSNCNYLNLITDIINTQTDFHSDNGHINYSGSKKVSDYLGKYIKEHYDIPDRRNDENYKSWFNDYENYLSYKTANINNQKIIENVLMLLSDKDFSACVYFKKNSQILKRKNISPLLENMAGQKLAQLEQAVKTNSGYCLIVDGDKKIICESAGEDFQDLETSFGNVSFFTKDGITNLQLQDKANKLNGDWYKPESKVSEPDAQIFVINNRTKKIVSTSRWDFARQENVSKRK